MACFCEKNDVRNRLHSSNFAHFYTRIITTHSLYKTFLCVLIFKHNFSNKTFILFNSMLDFPNLLNGTKEKTNNVVDYCRL